MCAGAAGIRYRSPTRAEHNRGIVTLLGARELLARGWGACGDLAAFDAGALLARDIAARVVITEGPWGAGSYHAQVLTERGLWDPATAIQDGVRSCIR